MSIRVDRVAVLGCGLAGIAAAAALHTVCGDIVIIERDHLPVKPGPRRGLPQANHLHNLLGRAQIELERLLPGFGAALRTAGCGEARVTEQTYVYEAGQHAPRRDLGLQILCAWRPVIDHVALRLLLKRGGVQIRDGMRAVGIAGTHNGRVSGVVLKNRNGTEERIHADIVVDATGAGSRADQWLAEVGQLPPQIDMVQVDRWYVTCLCERPSRLVGDETFWLIFPSPPHKRAGLVSPATPTQWYVSLSGCSDDEPPQTFGAMQAFAAKLEDLSIALLLEHAANVETPHLFRRPIATWRRHDHLPKPLVGFLPIGDSIGTLNPLFGQGISVAAWQASGLADLLADRLADPSRDRLAQLTLDYLQHAATVCGRAWTLEADVDRAVRGSNGDDRRRRALTELIRNDPELQRRYVGIWHLLEPAEILEEPSIASRLSASVK